MDVKQQTSKSLHWVSIWFVYSGRLLKHGRLSGRAPAPAVDIKTSFCTKTWLLSVSGFRLYRKAWFYFTKEDIYYWYWSSSVVSAQTAACSPSFGMVSVFRVVTENRPEHKNVRSALVISCRTPSPISYTRGWPRPGARKLAFCKQRVSVAPSSKGWLNNLPYLKESLINSTCDVSWITNCGFEGVNKQNLRGFFFFL